MFDFHMALERILDIIYGSDVRYRVTVDGTGTHYSRSYRKASQAYETEVEFAKLFSRPSDIALVKVEGGEAEYVKFKCAHNNKLIVR